jgi:hypothetical protein
MSQLPQIDDYPARLRFRFRPLCATPLPQAKGDLCVSPTMYASCHIERKGKP